MSIVDENPPKKEKKQYKILSVRFDPEEYSKISSLAEAEGVSVSDLARNRLLGKRLQKKAEKKEYASLVSAINRVGGNINQIARWCNSHQQSTDVVDVMVLLEEIKDSIHSLK